jgi:hypothetical protein
VSGVDLRLEHFSKESLDIAMLESVAVHSCSVVRDLHQRCIWSSVELINAHLQMNKTYTWLLCGMKRLATCGNL